MSTSILAIHLPDSKSSNILTPLSMMPSSSLSPVSQSERFKVNNAKEIIEVDTVWKLSGLNKEVDKEGSKKKGKELEWKDTIYFNPADFWWAGMMPLLGTSGILYFSGVNVSDFYIYYKAMIADYYQQNGKRQKIAWQVNRHFWCFWWRINSKLMIRYNYSIVIRSNITVLIYLWSNFHRFETYT